MLLDDSITQLSIKPGIRLGKGQRSVTAPIKVGQSEHYVPGFPLGVILSVVDAGLEKALPLILAIHRQLTMTKREWTPLNSAVWRAASDPTAKEKEAILTKLRAAPGIIQFRINRTPVSHYSVSKGTLWQVPEPTGSKQYAD